MQVVGDADHVRLGALFHVFVRRGRGRTYLFWESAGTEITKRKLESTVATIDIDFQSDQSIRVSSRC